MSGGEAGEMEGEAGEVEGKAGLEEGKRDDRLMLTADIFPGLQFTLG